MSVIFTRMFDERIDAIRTYRIRHGSSYAQMIEFGDFLYDELVKVEERNLIQVPYAFVIIRDDNPNNERNACCPIYSIFVEFCSKQYIVFYFYYINKNGCKNLYGLCVYSARSTYKKFVKERTSATGIIGEDSVEHRANYYAIAREQGYILPDTLESCHSIAYIYRCYEHHLRVPLIVRESLRRRGYRVVEGRVLDIYDKSVSE